jgi:hypothetical protein
MVTGRTVGQSILKLIEEPVESCGSAIIKYSVPAVKVGVVKMPVPVPKEEEDPMQVNPVAVHPALDSFIKKSTELPVAAVVTFIA